jgi:hypothetical protein
MTPPPKCPVCYGELVVGGGDGLGWARLGWAGRGAAGRGKAWFCGVAREPAGPGSGQATPVESTERGRET